MIFFEINIWFPTRIDKKEPNIKTPYNIAKLSPIFNNLIHIIPEQK